MRFNYGPALDWIRYRYLAVGLACIVLLSGAEWIITRDTPGYVLLLTLLPVAGWMWCLHEGPLHAQRMCDQCIHHAVTASEDDAHHRMPLLRIAHLFLGSNRLSVAIVIAVFTGTFLAHPYWQIVGNGIFAATGIAMISASMHDRYLRWCPWCRDDDGDDDHEFEPDPVESERVR
jgi:hypothetical protein